MPIVILNSMVLLNLNCFSGLFFLRKLLDQIIYVHPISRLVWKARGISKIRCYIFVRLWEIYFSRIRNIFVCSHLLISWKGVRYFSDKVLYICQIMRNIFLKDQIYICVLPIYGLVEKAWDISQIRRYFSRIIYIFFRIWEIYFSRIIYIFVRFWKIYFSRIRYIFVCSPFPD